MHTIKEHCINTPDLELIGSASTLNKAYSGIIEYKPQLIFLDMHLPDGYGFSLLAKLEDLQPLVIVTSGYRQYALEGFAHGIVDYLEKPVYADRFDQAIRRVKQRFTPLPLSLIKEELQISKVDEIKKEPIYISDILFIEANENYVKVITDTQTQLLRTTLKNVYEQLPVAKFSQISRSYIISLDKVSHVERHTAFIGIGKKYELAIRHSFRSSFYKIWQSYKQNF